MDLWHYIMQNIAGICSWSSLRATCAVFFTAVSSVLSTMPNMTHPSLPFLVALICIDFILAAGIALYENRFTWPGFRHGMGKFVGYGLIFIVTSLADEGIGASQWPVNLTVSMSCYGIAGESISSLRHIDHIFPGLLPNWLIARLETIRYSIERNESGRNRRSDDWRGYWRQGDDHPQTDERNLQSEESTHSENTYDKGQNHDH